MAEGKRTKAANLIEKLSVQKILKLNNSQGPFHFQNDGPSKTIGKTKPQYVTRCKIQAPTNSGNRLYVNCSKHPDSKHDQRNIKDETT